MYEAVKKILDKSKETGEDILVARDMCIADAVADGEKAGLRAAGDLICEHYDVITKCRREGDEASIGKLCELIKKGTPEDVREFKKEIMER